MSSMPKSIDTFNLFSIREEVRLYCVSHSYISVSRFRNHFKVKNGCHPHTNLCQEKLHVRNCQRQECCKVSALPYVQHCQPRPLGCTMQKFSLFMQFILIILIFISVLWTRYLA